MLFRGRNLFYLNKKLNYCKGVELYARLFDALLFCAERPRRFA